MPPPIKPPTAPSKAGLLVEGGIIPIELHYVIRVTNWVLKQLQSAGFIKALPAIMLHSPAADRVELKVDLPPSRAEIEEIMEETVKAIGLILATAAIAGGIIGGVGVYYLAK